MKKATIITIIAALLLLIVSCNVDSEHGIYYQVNTSQPTSGISIIQSMGCSDDGYHMFLSDDGIYYTPSTKGGTEPIQGSQGKNIRGAFFYEGTMMDCFFYSNREGKVFTLNPDGTSSEYDKYADYKFEVSSNGFLYNKDYYAVNGEDLIEAKISNPRFSGDFMFSMDGTTKAVIYDKNGNTLNLTGFTANATGFTVAKDSSSYFVFNDKSVYEVSDAQTELNDETLVVSGLEAAPTGGYKAVQYSDDTNTYLLVRTSKGFTKIDTTEDEVVEKNVQFLSALNDVVILDMYTIGDSSKIAIVTYANGIRIADMENKTVTDDIL